MSEFGNLVCIINPETDVLSTFLGKIFGNPIVKVCVYEKGLSMNREKGQQHLAYTEIKRISARNYTSLSRGIEKKRAKGGLPPDPLDRFPATGVDTGIGASVFIDIYPVNNQKPIAFKLLPDLESTKALLDSFCEYLLGPQFPSNLEELELELGGIGAPIYLRGGQIVFGEKSVSISDVEAFTSNQNGWYDLKLKGVKRKLGISPEYATNIRATLAVMQAILTRNK